jgi:exopolysaccharide production protein ExoQ
MTLIATVAYLIGIVALFRLDRDKEYHPSKALWIPVIWLLINGSRPISAWLQITPQNLTDTYLEGSPIDRNIYFVLLIIGLVVLFRRGERVGRLISSNRAICIFVIYCAISIAWSDYPLVAFKRWLKMLGDMVMVLIVLTDTSQLNAIKKLFARVGFILIPLSVLLIKYFPERSRYYSRWEGKQFFSGVATDKNMLGLICLVYGLGILWRFFESYLDKSEAARSRHLLALGIVLAMMIWLFKQANSMTSLSCFAVSGGLMAIMRFRREPLKPMAIHLLAVGAIGACIGILFFNVGTGSLEIMGRDSTLTGRTEIWEGLREFNPNFLFGTGFDSFWLGERLERIWARGGMLNGINEAHSGYLEVWLNLGGAGLALIIGLIFVGYKNILVSLNKHREYSGYRIAFFISVIIYNFTEAGFRILSPIWMAFLLATIAIPEDLLFEKPVDRPISGCRSMPGRQSSWLPT